MSQTKCDKCRKLAYTAVDGVLYCENCMPIPEACTCESDALNVGASVYIINKGASKKKKSWWRRIKDMFIGGYTNNDLHI